MDSLRRECLSSVSRTQSSRVVLYVSSMSSENRVIPCALLSPRWVHSYSHASCSSMRLRTECLTSCSASLTREVCCSSTSRICVQCLTGYLSIRKNTLQNTETYPLQPSEPSSVLCCSWRIREPTSSSENLLSTSMT